MPAVNDPNLLIGWDTRDDAAVYQLQDDLALVQTIDFITPIVDDPEQFGAIAAANALSDIYAMGGKPILALNVVCFPRDLNLDILSKILNGADRKTKEAGVIIVGGHTIDDEEPKYGLSVTGLVIPGNQISKSTARIGDNLVLTKPIGTGIITTGIKKNEADEVIVARAVAVMCELNQQASEAMIETGVNACTDITGFGLMGHLQSMLHASGVSGHISLGAVPVIEGTWAMVDAGIIPDGTHRNLDYVDPFTTWHSSLDKKEKLVLSDAQTSGGLLISVAADKVSELLDNMVNRGITGVEVIGEVIGSESGNVQVSR